MDKKFLMGNNDWLKRSRAGGDKSTIISPRLHKKLITAAMRRAYDFYSNFFNLSIKDFDLENLIAEYERDCSHALSLGLFAPGGIRKKDHLNLWCLSHIFLPEIYVESGVFIGSSLHAFINSPQVKKIIAIDPDLTKLKLPKKSLPGVELIDDKDFSQLKINFRGIRSLAYFDDHVDTASRVIQASEKGFRYVLFDDSTGLEGVCQRLFPAVPTIPMIMNAEILSPGDELSWTYHRPSATGLRSIVNKAVRRETTRIKLIITKELIEKCFVARKAIRKFEVIPDLGEFIPQSHPEKMVDTSKFIVELNQS